MIVPLGVMRPILLLSPSTNQRLPSGPVMISAGALLDAGRGNSVIVPLSSLVGVGVRPAGCDAGAPQLTKRPTSVKSSTGSTPLRGGT